MPGETLATASGESGALLLGVAAVITALGGLIGGLAALIGAIRRNGLSSRVDAPDTADPEGIRLWRETLERLEEAYAENDKLRRQLGRKKTS